MEFSNLTICIPAYNEEQAIAETLRTLQAAFPYAEIIVVSDGSTDNTCAIAEQFNQIKLIRHSRNMGYGAALKTAMRSATKEVIAWYDADGQYTPQDLMHVICPVVRDEKDMVVGARGPGSDIRLGRLPGKLIIKYAAQLVVGEGIPDLNSGLRCIKTAVVRKYLHILPEGFSASTTLTLLMMKRNYRVGYEPITTKKRIGHSSVKILRDGFKTLHLILHIFILFEAFKFFTILAAFQFIPAMMYGFYLAFSRKLGFPTLASTFAISGVLTFFMGIITDQIVQLRKERFEER